MTPYKLSVLRIALLGVIFPIVVACSAMTSFLADKVLDTDSGGGIDTEIVVGDKEQVLGTNQEVKAESIGKVVGTSDNSVQASNAKEVTVNNTTFPVWAILFLAGLATLIGYLAPRPKAWKRLIQRNPNVNSD